MEDEKHEGSAHFGGAETEKNTLNSSPPLLAPDTEITASSELTSKSGSAKSGKNVISRLLNSVPRAYTAEYILLLIVMLSLVMMASSMFGTIVDYIGDQPHPRFGGGFAYTASIAMLAGVAVLVPVFAILTRRTKSLEVQVPSASLSGWRRGALALFLLIIAFNAIGYAIAFFYDVFSWLASFGLGTDTEAVAWKSILKHLFAFGLFASTAMLYAKDYRAAAEDVYRRWARVHRYALAVIVLILSGVFVAIPVQAQRGTFIDQTIVNDLRSIRTKVQDYEREKSSLPDSFSDLALSDETKSRSRSFSYEYKNSSSSYELCAVFKTDTTEKERSGGNILEQISSGASLYDYQSEDDPGVHSKGRDCFNYEARYSSYNSPITTPNIYDYPLQ